MPAPPGPASAQANRAGWGSGNPDVTCGDIRTESPLAPTSWLSMLPSKSLCSNRSWEAGSHDPLIPSSSSCLEQEEVA